nr:MAG TPA: portal protein [Caudoviricetes sp.]
MTGRKMTPASVSAEYDAGVRFNTGIDLYDTVQTNENFFIGKQWEGVKSNGLPTPVFNFLKRVVLFSVANVSTDNLKLHAKPLQSSGNAPTRALEAYSDILNDQFAAIFERNQMGGKIREFCRNAAVDGDGCLYAYWDSSVETGQSAKGAIGVEVLQNTQVLFGNPNSRDVQSQPYIIIERRMIVNECREYAREQGAGAMDIENITADDRESGNIEIDQLGGDKVTVLLRLWRDRKSGTIRGYECTRGSAEIRKEWDLGITLYPIVWMNWDYVQDCYHGQAMITGLIPNQIFVNKLFAMSMISLMTLAYPKVVYDRTKVAKWSSKVGAAIGVNGSVDNVAKIIDPASISPQISQFIDVAIGYTQKFLGASDVALGDTRPDNTSAIIALQRAAATPMELTKQNLLQGIEQLGRIFMEFEAEYYGTRTVEVEVRELGQKVSVPFDFTTIKSVPCSIDLDAGASSYWSEIANMQTLDNLLMQGKIPTSEYLRRLPTGQITDREALIAITQAAERGTMAQTPGDGSDSPMDPTGFSPPVRGGAGYGSLQRKINESGEVPRKE